MPAELASDCVKVLAALQGAARLTRTQVSYDVFARNRTVAQLEAIGAALESGGRILRLRVESEGGRRDRPIEVWEVISSGAGFANGSSPKPDGPPEGEGWLPRGKTLRLARRGVVPAVAARRGRSIRKADAARGRAGTPKLNDEDRGAAHYIRKAEQNYRETGVVEAQGDWIRLVHNPKRRPPHHWHESLLHFLAQGHPTLDGKWHRKPKPTLTAVTEDALGRKLNETEQVYRRHGRTGSWNPEDIVLMDWETGTATLLSQIRT